MALGSVAFWYFTSPAWQGEHRFNLVLSGSSTGVLSIYPPEKTAVFLIVPNETLVRTLEGYGFYRIEAIWELGDQEGKNGGEFLAGSLQEALAIPIDAYARVDDLVWEKSKIDAALLSLVKGRGETNLSFWDRVKLYAQFKPIRPYKINVLNLSQLEVLDQEPVAEVVSVWKLNQERADQLLAAYFKDPEIRQEDLSLAVLNGTLTPGLAKKGARLLTNIGGRVIAIADWDLGTNHCLVKIKAGDKEKIAASYTLTKIKKIFACQEIEADLGDYRVDLIVVLGEDYRQKVD